MISRLRWLWLLLCCLSSVVSANQALIAVIGAGPAGLAAAIEAADQGAQVILIDMNSVPGGHGVKAGGWALVDTDLQRRKGIQDSPELAIRDWQRYGETRHSEWLQAFARASNQQVYQWLVQQGVEFRMLLPSAENSVPRFHFTRGGSIHVMLPLIQTARKHDAIHWLLNHRAENISAITPTGYRLSLRQLRTQQISTLDVDAVILATGGFQGALDKVKEAWSLSPKPPSNLLIGGSRFATGSALELSRAFQAQTRDLSQQVIFPNALENPRLPGTALALRLSSAIWVNQEGKRFVNEVADDKQRLTAIVQQPQHMYWAITDSRGIKRLMVRDAPWLNRQTIAAEILQNPALVKQADSIAGLAKAMEVSSTSLTATLEQLQRSLQEGETDPWQRPSNSLQAITQPPFYAIKLQLMSRKNLGGLAINQNTQLLDPQNQPIPGLYAAGEATGVAGINGQHGMSGTFLAPSVWLGRLAGQHAAGSKATTRSFIESIEINGADNLQQLMQQPQEGYWHSQQVHQLVLEQQKNCGDCHQQLPPQRPSLAEQLSTCTHCH